MTAPAAAGLSSSSSSTSTAVADGNIPVLLLKTRSTPTDGYEEYFSSRPPFRPVFVPVLQHVHVPTALSHIASLFTNGAFAPSPSTSSSPLIASPPSSSLSITSPPPSASPSFSSSPSPHSPSTQPNPNPKYGGLIFTSHRAVEAFASVLASLSTSSSSLSASSPPTPPLAALTLPLYTVGPATARALLALRDVHLPNCSVEGAHTGNGEALAHFILEHYARPSRGDTDTDTDDAIKAHKRLPLLFCVGEQRRDVIPRTLQSEVLKGEERVRVDEVVVYETGVVEGFEWDLRGELERTGGEEGGRGRWVVVFSPVGGEALVGVLGLGLGRLGEGAEGGGGEERGARVEGDDEEDGNWKRRRRTFVACIGPTTRDYLKKEFAVEVDVCAQEPSPEGVGRGIEVFMRERARGEGG